MPVYCYLRDFDARKAANARLPEDMSKDDFLKAFRKSFAKTCSVRIEKATCHDEPHKRFNKTQSKRERHRHIVLKVSGNFAQKKVAKAFQKEHGIHISFSFKFNRFVGYLTYCMEPGKKPAADLDMHPAKYPESLDLDKELSLQMLSGVFLKKAV